MDSAFMPVKIDHLLKVRLYTRIRSFFDDPDVELWPDDKVLTVTEVDEPGKPKHVKTGKEWAMCGKGFVASTEY